jgi:hypothetical protein
MTIHGLFYGGQQLRGLLNLVKHDAIGASPQGFGTLARLPERVEIVQAVEAPVFERLGVEQQGAFADLPCAGQDDDRVILAGLLQGSVSAPTWLQSQYSS